MKVKHKIHLASQHELRSLLGAADANIRKIGSELSVQVVARDQTISLQGPAPNVSNATMILDELLTIVRSGADVQPRDVERLLEEHFRDAGGRPSRRSPPVREIPNPFDREADTAGAGGFDAEPAPREHSDYRGPERRGRSGYGGAPAVFSPNIGRGTGAPPYRTGVAEGLGIAARSPGQKAYLSAIQNKRLVFGVGPAGTGKTFLAAGRAVEALISGRVSRIMLVRPAVEAGEKLGYLPGDLREKIDPYLRPLYDALNDLLSPNQVLRYMERGSIEIAPLAYMRGRTINNTFAILDEAQNTTAKQMLMFLTRMGENSQMVVTGDMTQTDLEGGQLSGLSDALRKLEGIPDIGVVHLTEQDIVRHPLVVQIVRAYENGHAPHHPLFDQARTDEDARNDDGDDDNDAELESP